MKKTKKLAFAAIMSALGIAVMLVGGYTGILDMTAVAVGSLIIMMAVIELGGAYPYLIWLTTAALSIILLPDKFAAVLYAVFGGIYPIFKAMFERLHPIVSWVLKFSFFNTSLTALIVITKYLFSAPDPIGFKVTVYLVCNGVFLLFDIACTGLVTMYLIKLRRRLGLGNYFK